MSSLRSSVVRIARKPQPVPRIFTAGLASQATSASLHRRQVGNRSVVVTGSAKGIGRAIALRLASDGYNVCVNDIEANSAECDEVVKEIRAMGRTACSAVGDVTKRSEVKDMVQKSVKELGPLQAMVANAGISQAKALLELTEEDFDRMLAVNLKGVHYCYAEAALQMISQGTCTPATPGKIIGAASIAAYQPTELMGPYSVSKWAVRCLTQSYAMEMAKHNITVNAYAPGIVGTSLWAKIDKDLSSQTGNDNHKTGVMSKKDVDEPTLVGRVSVPENIANLVSFQASSDSDYITGQTHIVNGGVVFS